MIRDQHGLASRSTKYNVVCDSYANETRGMKRFIVTSVLAVVFCTKAAAAPLEAVAPDDTNLSYVYHIVDIQTVRSAGIEVRVFQLGKSQDEEANLAVRVVADKRLPPGKVARIAVWSLPYRLESIEAVSLDDTTIRIDGWLPLGDGPASCTLVLGFDDRGVLLDQLEDKGCVSSE